MTSECFTNAFDMLVSLKLEFALIVTTNDRFLFYNDFTEIILGYFRTAKV